MRCPKVQVTESDSESGRPEKRCPSHRHWHPRAAESDWHCDHQRPGLGLYQTPAQSPAGAGRAGRPGWLRHAARQPECEARRPERHIISGQRRARARRTTFPVIALNLKVVMLSQSCSLWKNLKSVQVTSQLDGLAVSY